MAKVGWDSSSLSLCRNDNEQNNDFNGLFERGTTGKSQKAEFLLPNLGFDPN
ncbi:hypothetical protein HPE56_01640 [Maribacter sp. ANRC-HE7]|uniref:Uncharacterized protein n=1 Tax=Maribacter aquimaris TaxID=2737171 RepID=A0ABR7UZM1_9FLAO|nr:hypothetical protein [Maribacter aquimaris]MBD0776481.1 hypothetical protein [Maribacter aquimaris]